MTPRPGPFGSAQRPNRLRALISGSSPCSEGFLTGVLHIGRHEDPAQSHGNRRHPDRHRLPGAGRVGRHHGHERSYQRQLVRLRRRRRHAAVLERLRQLVEPSVDCTTNDGVAAFWVGLGGAGQGNGSLEQVGTQATCSNGSSSGHYAWYELVPAAPVRLDMTVNPGDHMNARVSVSGTTVA